MLALTHSTTRSAFIRLRVRWALATVLVFVSFLVASLSAPSLPTPYLASASRDVLAGEVQNRHDDDVAKQAEVCRVPSARRLHRAEPTSTPRIRSATTYSLNGASVLALALHAPSVALGARLEPRLEWSRGAPTRPELMVFLN